MTTLHATPYNIDATGFYFTDINEYETKATSLVDCCGNLVEEFEIQFMMVTMLSYLKPVVLIKLI